MAATVVGVDGQPIASAATLEYEIQCFDGGDQRLYAPFFYQNGQPGGFLELAIPPAIPGLPPPTPGIPFTSTNRAFIRAYLSQKLPYATERMAKKGLRAVGGS